MEKAVDKGVSIKLVLIIPMCKTLFLHPEGSSAITTFAPLGAVFTLPYLDSRVLLVINITTMLLLLFVIVLTFVSGKNRRTLAENALIVKRITDSISIGIVTTIWNAEQNIVYANDGFYNMIGYTPEEFYKECANSLVKLIKQGDNASTLKSLNEKLASGEQIVLEFQIKRRDGRNMWLRANGVLSPNSRSIKAISYIFVDISEVREAQQRLAVDEERYRMISDMSDEYIFEYTHGTDTMMFAEKYKKDFNSETVIQNYRSRLLSRSMVYREDLRILQKILSAAKSVNKKMQFELRLIDRNNNMQWHRVMCRAIYDKGGKPYKTIGKFVNIDSEKKEREALKFQAQTDPLTKLYNRSQFETRVSHYLQNSEDNAQSALLVVDIDGFKEANDKMGHLMGDKLLTEVADTLKEIFEPRDTIGRLGGDEFVVFIKDAESKAVVEQHVAQLCRSLNKEYIKGEHSYTMSVSVGVVVSKDCENFSSLFKVADKALYNAKNSGKNRYEILIN